MIHSADLILGFLKILNYEKLRNFKIFSIWIKICSFSKNYNLVTKTKNNFFLPSLINLNNEENSLANLDQHFDAFLQTIVYN
ncbi:hypothetical protein BpHYR1_026522 [Brachionus plicatilis]|uniref:Uncharacterized protein n=1 Tax=Brachionus plicatilis TaxID=10195 RepID=A0A3M7QUG9_BRAPC|nr:hypothetical protein BpHYR1_026522 [Brachionus plicatilis]